MSPISTVYVLTSKNIPAVVIIGVFLITILSLDVPVTSDLVLGNATMKTPILPAAASALVVGCAARVASMESISATTTYHRVMLDGVGIFYREAGPTLVGFDQGGDCDNPNPSRWHGMDLL